MLCLEIDGAQFLQKNILYVHYFLGLEFSPLKSSDFYIWIQSQGQKFTQCGIYLIARISKLTKNTKQTHYDSIISDLLYALEHK